MSGRGYNPLRAGIPTREKGAPDGVATLDSAGRLAHASPLVRTGTNRYSLGLSIVQTGATLALAETRTYLAPFMADVDRTVTRVGLRILTAAAGSVVHLGMYGTQDDGWPGTLVEDFGTVDTSTTGAKELVVSRPVVAGELFYIAALAIGGTPVTRSVLPFPGLAQFVSAAGAGSGDANPFGGAFGETSLVAGPLAGLGSNLPPGPLLYVRFS